MQCMNGTEHIRMAVERFYTEIWNRRDLSQIPALLAPDFTFRGSLGQSRTGHAGFASYDDALADYRCDIVELVVEAPKAFARMRFSGLHRGHFLGRAPTGKPVEWAGAARFAFRGEHIADLWVLGDIHGLLELLDRNAA